MVRAVTRALVLTPLIFIALADIAHSQQPVWDLFKEPGEFIVSLASDKQGNVWVGTEDKGVFRYSAAKKQWTQFTTKDGLGDNNGYAICEDRLGRIWVGLLNHGVAVFNGESWKTYDVLEGPFGERVFDLAVSPIDGDVWMATSAGLSRYSESKDNWTSYTRGEGLPEDQANALAFDHQGTLFVGTQCQGIAIGRATDKYEKWLLVPGPETIPMAATGPGLPSPLINDLLVTRDGTVHAATCAGLATSSDGGRTWSYLRGRDYPEKVRNGTGGPPAGWEDPPAAAIASLLPEDYVTCLAETSAGSLLIGFRQRGLMSVQTRVRERFFFTRENSALLDDYVASIHPTPEGRPWVATYGGGLCQAKQTIDPAPTSAPKPSRIVEAGPKKPPSLPSIARAPTALEIKKMQTFVERLISKPRSAKTETQASTPWRPAAIGLADDWRTQGDFYGTDKYSDYRYGMHSAMLCAHSSPIDGAWGLEQGVFAGWIGANMKDNDRLRRWVHDVETTNPRSLKDPYHDKRRQAEWDDHGEAYPMSHEGPHVYCTFSVPPGPHYISLYFFNKDGHSGNNRFRDFVLTMKQACRDEAQFTKLPVLARSRVRDFWGGVYKVFVVQGGPQPFDYTVQIHDNWSFNTILSGIFVDPVVENREEWGGPIGTVRRLRHQFEPGELANRRAGRTGQESDFARESLDYFSAIEEFRIRQPVMFSMHSRRLFHPILLASMSSQAIDIDSKTRNRIEVECLHQLRFFDARDAIISQLERPAMRTDGPGKDKR